MSYNCIILGQSLEWKRDGVTDGENGDNKNNEQQPKKMYKFNGLL